MQNASRGQLSKGSVMPVEKSARKRNHQNHGPMRIPHRDSRQYAAVIRDGQGAFGAKNKGELAMTSANRHDARVAETYQVERLLEFLERGPAWLRGLVWDVMVLFMKEDDGEFKAE
ncbi:MAG TPA: hypothetical protein VGY58_19685 [Gemmataceae bacterium]|nr:hypothetical protein [Gemmataceae bacterium]